MPGRSRGRVLNEADHAAAQRSHQKQTAQQCATQPNTVAHDGTLTRPANGQRQIGLPAHIEVMGRPGGSQRRIRGLLVTTAVLAIVSGTGALTTAS